MVAEEVDRKLSDELVERLIDTGMKKNLAITLVFVAQYGETTGRTMEANTRLRQPDTSLATNELIRMGLLKRRELPKEGRGRPVFAYSLKKSIDDTVRDIEKGERKKIEEIEYNIRRIWELKNEMF